MFVVDNQALIRQKLIQHFTGTVTDLLHSYVEEIEVNRDVVLAQFSGSCAAKKFSKLRL